MPRDSKPVYQRGKYRLEWDRDAAGGLRSPYLAVFWYDAAARRNRSRSTRTAETERAIVFLDRLYLADAEEAPAFCPTCGRGMASARAYLIADSIADYRLEHGDAAASAGSIAARLGNVLDFLEATDRSAATCDEAAALVDPLRRWLADLPVKGSERRRSPAAVEEAVHQFRAVLRHARSAKRIEAVPTFKGRPRADVSPQRTERADIATLARMLVYAADPEHPRRRPLHAFLVASICTLARPDAVFDISTAAKRNQVQGGLLALNPAGRVQTRKRRPLVPVPPVLAAWLADVAADPKSKGWLCEVAGNPVSSVKTAWRTMLADLGLPEGREWQPYIVRHSMATLLRDHGAEAWDLSGQMGHRIAGTTEIYAASTLYTTAQAALAKVLAALEQAALGAMHRRRTGVGSNVVRLGAGVRG